MEPAYSIKQDEYIGMGLFSVQLQTVPAEINIKSIIQHPSPLPRQVEGSAQSQA